MYTSLLDISLLISHYVKYTQFNSNIFNLKKLYPIDCTECHITCISYLAAFGFC